MDPVHEALAIVLPGELDALWGYVRLLERMDEMTPDEAARWKLGMLALSEFFYLDSDESPAEWVSAIPVAHGRTVFSTRGTGAWWGLEYRPVEQLLNGVLTA